MATIDFTPLFRSAVGFDRLHSLLSHALERDESGFPPYNIEKTGEDSYRIVIALAGYKKDDLEIVCEQNRMMVRGEQTEKDGKTYLFHGIASRTFQRVFDLADYVEVTGANFSDGLLIIDLRRSLPEEHKPKRIEISTNKRTERKTLEKSAA